MIHGDCRPSDMQDAQEGACLESFSRLSASQLQGFGRLSVQMLIFGFQDNLIGSEHRCMRPLSWDPTFSCDAITDARSMSLHFSQWQLPTKSLSLKSMMHWSSQAATTNDPRYRTIHLVCKLCVHSSYQIFKS